MSKELPWQYWLKPTQSNNTIMFGVCENANEPILSVKPIIPIGELNLYDGCMLVCYFEGGFTSAGSSYTKLKIGGTEYPCMYYLRVADDTKNNSNALDEEDNVGIFVLYHEVWYKLNPGIADKDCYGIATLSDTRSTTNNVNHGTAATPKCVQTCYDDLKILIDDLDSRISALGG